MTVFDRDIEAKEYVIGPFSNANNHFSLRSSFTLVQLISSNILVDLPESAKMIIRTRDRITSVIEKISQIICNFKAPPPGGTKRSRRWRDALKGAEFLHLIPSISRILQLQF
jgi:hypothetical protein